MRCNTKLFLMFGITQVNFFGAFQKLPNKSVVWPLGLEEQTLCGRFSGYLKKQINMHLTFLGLEEIDAYHSMHWRLISGSYSRHFSLLMSFRSRKRFFGTIFAQMFLICNFSFKNSSLTILTANGRYECTRCRILSIFLSVLEAEGLLLYG